MGCRVQTNMSIITKIITLFTISFILTSLFWYKSNTLQNEKIEYTITQNYLKASDEIYKYLIDNNNKALQKRLEELNYTKTASKPINNTIYEYQTSFGFIKVLYDKNEYFLYLKYLDDELVLKDLSQQIEFDKKNLLDYIMILQVLILIILFAIVINIFRPLKNISQKIAMFGNGDYSTRIEFKGSDELSTLANTFDTMAQNIETLILERNRLLKDIGHELRTPITKAKFALEMIENSKYKTILQTAFTNIDTLTNELLEIEKFKTQNDKAIKDNFYADTLLLSALSKLMIDDESIIDIDVKQNFQIHSNIDYLSIALKNLIDNSIKYATSYPIIITINSKEISIKNKGSKLNKEFEYYTQEFTKDDNSRNTKGYGLGLNIIKNILDYYKYTLSYSYEDGYNNFTITF